MRNSFFEDSLDKDYIIRRIQELDHAKVGFYSIGLYPASIAYNSAMQEGGKFLLLAPRPGRKLLGAFSETIIKGMDPGHIQQMQRMSCHGDELELGEATHSSPRQVPNTQVPNTQVPNTLEYLIQNCDLVMLSANSNYIEQDLAEARRLRSKLGRNSVVLSCLAGSYSHDNITNESYVLCQKYPNLAFFSGFHRHDALRSPFDSFTANFCHPNALTALLGAHILDKLSLNIQVSPGVHNVEAQYIKVAKNMASIFAGFGYEYHRENSGVLPTLLTLLLNQCLDQAATISMSRRDRQKLYNHQLIDLTELGYGVPGIEATINSGGNTKTARDHTFSQLTAMVADVRGSMMMPVRGKPTRNFQAGQILAKKMRLEKRCPYSIGEFEDWCEAEGVQKGGLEGVKALRYWPQIRDQYNIPSHDASMVNLLYMVLCGEQQDKDFAFEVMTESRQLSSYCQESVRPSHSRKYSSALNNLDKPESLELLANVVLADNARKAVQEESGLDEISIQPNDQAYLKAMSSIEMDVY